MFQQDSFGDSKHAAAKGIGFLFGAALFLLSAVTSAAFFYQYAASPFAPFAGSLAPLLAAIAGVLVFEGASVTWSWLRSNDSDTSQQLTVSSIGAWSGLIGGIAVTIVYFGLNTDLMVLDETAIYLSSVFGVLLIVGGVSVNFCLAFIYRLGASEQQQAQQQAQLRALQQAASFTVQREHTEAAMIESVAAIRDSIPTAARNQAQQAQKDFLDQQISSNHHQPASVN